MLRKLVISLELSQKLICPKLRWEFQEIGANDLKLRENMLDLRCSRCAINAKRYCTVLSATDITDCLHARRQQGIRSKQPIFGVPRTLEI